MQNPLAPIIVAGGFVITINAGIVIINNLPVLVPQTVVSLTPSATNFVLISSSGTIQVNTTGFTFGCLPVATITTNTTGIQTVSDSRPDFTLTPSSPFITGLTINIDGSGSSPATGIHARWSAPTQCTITGWVLVADQSGSAIIDVKRSTYAGFPTTVSIAGTDKPTLSSVQKNENLGPLSSWTSTAIAKGDVLEFNLSSVVTCTVLSLTLNITVP